MDRLKGKKAIVTGAARGLGAAIVEHLAAEGCDIVAWDIDLEGVQETARQVAAGTGQTVRGARANITDAEAEQLKKEKGYLFGEKTSGSVAVRTSPAKEQRSGAGALERAAKRAAGTGSRSDLQEYMRRRRSVV